MGSAQSQFALSGTFAAALGARCTIHVHRTNGGYCEGPAVPLEEAQAPGELVGAPSLGIEDCGRCEFPRIGNRHPWTPQLEPAGNAAARIAGQRRQMVNHDAGEHSPGGVVRQLVAMPSRVQPGQVSHAQRRY